MRHCAKSHQNRWNGRRIWRFNAFFQNGGRPPSGICKIRIFLTVGAVKGPISHQRTKFRKHRSNRCEDIAIFVIFQDGGCRHLGFLKISKIRNFSGRSAVGANLHHCTKSHPNRSNGCRDMAI